MRQKGRPFTEKEFGQMKLLQSMGKSTMDAHRIFNRSSSTTAYVFRAETFDEYRRLARKTQHDSYTKKPNLEETEGVVESVEETLNKAVADTLNKILETLDKHTEMLKLIPKRRKF